MHAASDALSLNTYHGRRKFWCAATDDLRAWAYGTPAGRLYGSTSSPVTGARIGPVAWKGSGERALARRMYQRLGQGWLLIAGRGA